MIKTTTGPRAPRTTSPLPVKLSSVLLSSASYSGQPFFTMPPPHRQSSVSSSAEFLAPKASSETGSSRPASPRRHTDFPVHPPTPPTRRSFQQLPRSSSRYLQTPTAPGGVAPSDLLQKFGRDEEGSADDDVSNGRGRIDFDQVQMNFAPSRPSSDGVPPTPDHNPSRGPSLSSPTGRRSNVFDGEATDVFDREGQFTASSSIFKRLLTS